MRFLSIFLISTLWFAVLIPWNGFLDPDAFYHAKVSALIWQFGFLKSFPWLDLTLLGAQYADLHVGFHVLTAPFTQWFGLFHGLRFATVLFAGVCVTVFWLCVRWLRVSSPLFWSVMLVTSHPFLLRILLGKATPLALLWFVVGVAATLKRRPWLVAMCALGFSLTHGGWIYLAGSVALLSLGDTLYSKLVQRMPLLPSIRQSGWLSIPAAFGGGVLGMLLHPNFPSNFIFSWIQIVTIGLGTPFKHVLLGNEWLPADPSALLVSLSPFVILSIVGLGGLILAPRVPLHHERARWLTSLGWVLAVLLALTMKSRRNVEYLVPLLALWCATLWSLVDLPRFVRFRHVESSASRYQRRLPAAIIILSLTVVIAQHVWRAWKDFHPPSYRDDVYRVSMSAISQRAEPGDRVFHSSWDEFPMLFAQDDRLRYISGMDPTFLYVASSTLSDAYRDVVENRRPETGDHTSKNEFQTQSSPASGGTPPTTIYPTRWRGKPQVPNPKLQVTRNREQEQLWSFVNYRLRAKYLFVSKARHQELLELVRSDSRYVQIADAEDSSAFVVNSINQK